MAENTPPPRQRVAVYIDGFNFFYGTLDGTPYKWLDLQTLAVRLRNTEDVVLVRYFTSMVFGKSMSRQATYLDALATLPLVKTQLGSFKHTTVKCLHGVCSFAGDRQFQTIQEKRTDVGIAVSMVDDAHHDRCDHFVLISGDSDLVPAVRLIRSVFSTKRVTVYVPGAKDIRRADELRQVANDAKPFPTALLKACLLPATIKSRSGATITKPANW